jgi:dTDP-4-dehydrorhamnose 3,5-epimerase
VKTVLDLRRTPLEGLLVITPRVFGDRRGFFYESYRASHAEHGIAPMVQVNVSRSARGVLRGLHFQLQQPQAKLISVIRGEVYDVAVDVRPNSATFGKWHAEVLSDSNHRQMYIPVGFAHGFCVLSEEADFLYQCSDYYHPESEVGVRWDDPAIGIEWPIEHPTLSDKDLRNVNLAEIPESRLPTPALRS